MLNEKLYKALEEIFGTVRISKENQIAEYSIPKKVFSPYKKNEKRYAVVNTWGETYSVCCPICGDTRFRLGFSYLFDQYLYPEKSKTPIYFGDYLCRCFNEECPKEKPEQFRTYKISLRNKDIFCDLSAITKVTPKATEYSKIIDMAERVQFPTVTTSLLSPVVPLSAIEYLEKRRFDIQQLDSLYMCRYVPAGSVWNSHDGKNSFVFYEDRLLIPIVQRTLLVSWQARLLTDTFDSKVTRKYIFPTGTVKSVCLYNMDNALFHRDLVICEGITDVWRIGENAIALFGTTMSAGQMRIIKYLWGWKGSCVVALDGDDETAYVKSLKIVETLRENKILEEGVAALKLAVGKDPADYTTTEINELITKCRTDCHN